MKKLKAIIFDMDGVLIDSEPFYMQQVMDFYTAYGQQVPLSKASKLAGSSYEAAWEMMASWWKEDICPEEMRVLYEEEYVEEPLDYKMVLNPYVRYILPRLKDMGLQLAIASSSSLEAITTMCESCELTSYFDVISSGHDFEESKPNPAIYLHTLKTLGLESDECLVIEDSTYGIEAAKRANIQVIAKKDSRYGFDWSQSDYQVDDMLEAYHVIKELHRS